MYVDLQLFIDDVCRVSGTPRAALTGRDRTRGLPRLRQAIIFVLVRKTPLAMKRIGTLLGGRDHSTVHYGFHELHKLLAQRDPDALRYYRIAIRCWVRQARRQAESRKRVDEEPPPRLPNQSRKPWWTHDRLERLRSLRTTGISQSQIARELGTTTNAVKHKIRDLGAAA